jgi:hypothetical protein
MCCEHRNQSVLAPFHALTTIVRVGVPEVKLLNNADIVCSFGILNELVVLTNLFSLHMIFLMNMDQGCASPDHISRFFPHRQTSMSLIHSFIPKHGVGFGRKGWPLPGHVAIDVIS